MYLVNLVKTLIRPLPQETQEIIPDDQSDVDRETPEESKMTKASRGFFYILGARKFFFLIFPIPKKVHIFSAALIFNIDQLL